MKEQKQYQSAFYSRHNSLAIDLIKLYFSIYLDDSIACLMRQVQVMLLFFTPERESTLNKQSLCLNII